MSATEQQDTDGRRRRTERSKTAIAQAVMDLVREAGIEPTADAVAERAQVSRRSVFRLFEQMDDLYAEVIVLAHAQVQSRLDTALLAKLPLSDRLAGCIERLSAIYEEVLPMRRLAERLRAQHPIIDQRLRQDTRDLARYLTALFRNELAKHDRPARETAFSALELSVSWQAWDTLRNAQGLSAKKARAVLQTTMSALLAP